MADHLSLETFRAGIADAINRASYGRERIILERRGRPIVALVSLEDLALLQRDEPAPKRRKG